MIHLKNIRFRYNSRYLLDGLDFRAGNGDRIGLLGPNGSGKTTLIEQLQLTAGAIERPGSVELGTTVCDFDDFEIRQQKSAALAVAPIQIGDIKVNLIDTPGYSEFAGDLRAGQKHHFSFVCVGVGRSARSRGHLYRRECDRLQRLPRLPSGVYRGLPTDG